MIWKSHELNCIFAKLNIDTAVKTNKIINTGYLPWIIVILAVVLLYAAYFLIYIPRQESMVEKRGFRILNEYAGNIEGKCDYYIYHLKNYGPYYVLRSLANNSANLDTDKNLVDDVIRKNNIETLINSLEPTMEVGFIENSEVLQKTENTQSSEKKPKKDIGYEMDPGNQVIIINGNNLIFREQNPDALKKSLEKFGVYKSSQSQNATNGASDTSTSNKSSENEKLSKLTLEVTRYLNNHNIKYKLPLTTLMDGLKFDRLLNNIILFDSNGVLYNSNHALIHDISNAKSLVDSLDKKQGGLVETFEVRGDNSRVMVIPFDFRGKRFYLAGFVSESDFYDKTRSIDNQFLLIVSGLLLLLLISMPALKIFLMNKKEILHARDATLAVVSFITGFGFLVLLVMGVMKYFVTDQQTMNQRLRCASNILAGNVQKDFNVVENLYQDVIRLSADSANPEQYNLSKNISRVFLRPYFVCKGKFKEGNHTGTMKFYFKTVVWNSDTVDVGFADSTGFFGILSGDSGVYFVRKYDKDIDGDVSGMYKKDTILEFDNKVLDIDCDSSGRLTSFFESLPADHDVVCLPLHEVFLIGADGHMMKAVTSTGATGKVPVDLNSRDYFSFLKSGKSADSWLLKDFNPAGDDQPYYIESIQSYNSGKHETSFSFYLPENLRKLFGAPVMAITSPVPSLYHQVLPMDMSFMIINESGDVLFHSIRSKNLHENFLAECDNNNRIAGAIRHRVTDVANINYNEKSWLARIVPLKNAPLYHITLIDLKFTQDKNARILLFTFYLMLATYLLIIIGILLIRPMRQKTKIAKKPWFCHWLTYRGTNLHKYVYMIFVQGIIIIFQVAGLLINDRPVTMFIYQMIFIVLSALSAIAILGKSSDPGQKVLVRRNFTMTLMTIILIILILLLIFLFKKLSIILGFMAVPLVFFLINMHRKGRLTTQEDSGEKHSGKYRMRIICDNDVIGLKVGRFTLFSLAEGRKKQVYHLYIFLWFLGLSAIPAIQYYTAVRHLEENLWQLGETGKFARDNLMMMNDVWEGDPAGMMKIPWYQRVTGNGIDHLKVDYTETWNFDHSGTAYSLADSIYARLPDPVIRSDNMSGLLKQANRTMEWQRGEPINLNGLISYSPDAQESFHYSMPGKTGVVTVNRTGHFRIGTLRWIIYIIVPLIVLLIIAWLLHHYLAEVLMNTRTLKWTKPRQMSWTDLLNDGSVNRILLVTLNDTGYFDHLKSMIKAGPPDTETKYRLVVQHVADLPSITTDRQKRLLKSEYVWIEGLEEVLRKPEKAGEIVAILQKLFRKAKGKLVVALPFDVDFIEDLFDKHASEIADDPDKQKELNHLRRDINDMFRHFIRFTGSIQAPVENPSEGTGPGLAKPDFGALPGRMLEMRYQYIWSNLTHLEKLILYDIAEDGMVNLKNRQTINRLEMKGLVKLTPTPELFYTGFRDYLNYQVDPVEVQSLEHHLRKQSKWRNMRYLILLILVPLLALVFIVQGTSIESIIGIFTGAVALFSALMRVSGGFSSRQTAEESG